MYKNAGKLAGKTVFITGASRGIGKAIALKAAKDKANVVIAAKTASPHAKLEGTIFSAAEEVEAAGGKCLPVQVDVREESQVQAAVEEAVKKFGGIDILVNNASAISLTGTLETPMKRYDLMNQINARGTFLVSKTCIPYLKKSKNPHVLNMSPPLSLSPRWFAHHVAYTMAKYGMSMCAVGMAEEFRDDGIAFNALWPRTAIWTAAMGMLGGDEAAKGCRTVDICADAFYAIVTRNSREFTGNICIDETVLREAGMKDFEHYSVVKGQPLILDGFIDNDNGEGNVVELGTGIGAKNEIKINAPSPGGNSEKKKSAGSAASQNLTPQVVFAEIVESFKANPDMKLAGIYGFEIDGDKWFLDGDNRSVGQGDPEGKAACTLIMKNADFVKTFTGEVPPVTAVMSGKIKVKGSMGAAMKLDKLLSTYIKQKKQAN